MGLASRTLFTNIPHLGCRLDRFILDTAHQIWRSENDLRRVHAPDLSVLQADRPGIPHRRRHERIFEYGFQMVFNVLPMLLSSLKSMKCVLGY